MAQYTFTNTLYKVFYFRPRIRTGDEILDRVLHFAVMCVTCYGLHRLSDGASAVSCMVCGIFSNAIESWQAEGAKYSST